MSPETKAGGGGEGQFHLRSVTNLFRERQAGVVGGVPVIWRDPTEGLAKGLTARAAIRITMRSLLHD